VNAPSEPLDEWSGPKRKWRFRLWRVVSYTAWHRERARRSGILRYSGPPGLTG